MEDAGVSRLLVRRVGKRPAEERSMKDDDLQRRNKMAEPKRVESVDARIKREVQSKDRTERTLCAEETRNVIRLQSSQDGAFLGSGFGRPFASSCVQDGPFLRMTATSASVDSTSEYGTVLVTSRPSNSLRERQVEIVSNVRRAKVSVRADALVNF